MAIRGSGLLYTILAVLFTVLLTACVEQGQLVQAITPTSSPIPSPTQETAISKATETPLAQVVASPTSVRAPRTAARTLATPTPVPQDSQPPTDVASDSVGVPVDDAFKAVQERGTSLGQFAIVLNGGSEPAMIRSVKGGVIKGKVANQAIGPDLQVKKHLSTITYEPFTLQIGMGMSRAFADWIEASFDGDADSVNGSVIAANPDLHSLSTREFRDALISEVTFPTLDAASKDQAFLTVKLEPERIFYRNSGGAFTFDSPSMSKTWLASNFRVEIGDLPTSRVSKIDSFTWKQTIVKNDTGAFREPTLRSASIEVPDIKLTISTADIQPWLDWHRDFVIDGRATEADEITGSITFLGPDLNEELAVIELFHIGIISVSLDQAEADREGMARFTVELYVEDMSFEHRADTITSTRLNVTSTLAPVLVQTPSPILVPTAEMITDAPADVQLLGLPDMVGPTVSVQYRLIDSMSDPVSVDVAYSLDRGRTYRKASRVLRSEGTVGLASSPSGVLHTFSWNAGADISTEQASEVLLRLVPFNDDSKGRPKISEAFEYHFLLDQVSRSCRIGSNDWTLSARLWDGLRTSLSRCQNDLLGQVDSLLRETEPDLGVTALSRITVRSDFEVLNEMLGSVDSGTVKLQEISGAVVSGRVSTSDLNESLKNQESLIEDLEAQLSSIGDDAQLFDLDLQTNLQKQQQILQTMSNVSKMLHDTAMAVIRNMR